MKWGMFPHSGSINHGCEALVRTMASIINMFDDDARVFLYTSSINSDLKYGLDKVARLYQIASEDIAANSVKGLLLRAKAKMLKKDAEQMFIGHKHLIYRQCDVALSIGGDNYCYTGMQHILSEHIKAINYWNKPSILWGCSLDREMLSKKVISELNYYKAIIARESITLDTLYDIGLGAKSYLATDPAFILPSQNTEWPDTHLIGKKVIGVNISPLINRYKGGDVIMRNYLNLINNILQDKDVYVAFIPHVEQVNNDDYVIAKKLSELCNSERIVLVPNRYNCMELKSLISKCHSFVGARTHATIAAYSSKVPTLVVGYSTKSKGIARDIFGSEDGLVIPVQDFSSETTLVESYEMFKQRHKEIQMILNNRIEGYSHMAYKALDILRDKFIK